MVYLNYFWKTFVVTKKNKGCHRNSILQNGGVFYYF